MNQIGFLWEKFIDNDKVDTVCMGFMLKYEEAHCTPSD